jgi:hypothetical protein
MFDGLNRFYCRDEDAGLLPPRLGAPANILIGWTRAGDARAHEAVTHLQAELDAAVRRAAEADNRLEEATAEARQLSAELHAALNRNEVLVVEAARARAEDAAVRRAQRQTTAWMGSRKYLGLSNAVKPRAHGSNIS